jgi:tetratricopeptide (TPR) repeat protein
MYRYNQTDNAIAAGHFSAAIALDDEFSRAHAGLSFTYWQNAFMHFDDDRKELLERAVGSAYHALQVDPQDPFASFNMGRALWLEGDVDGGIDWLDRALTVNPNYAQCYYTMGMTQLLSGSSEVAQDAADRAIRLSPLDPLLYAMFSTKALSHIANEDFAAASQLAEKAVRVPGAHFYIAIITAIALELGGNREGAEVWRDKALAERPDFTVAMFFKAFPFKDPSMQSRIARSLTRLGIL